MHRPPHCGAPNPLTTSQLPLPKHLLFPTSHNRHPRIFPKQGLILRACFHKYSNNSKISSCISSVLTLIPPRPILMGVQTRRFKPTSPKRCLVYADSGYRYSAQQRQTRPCSLYRPLFITLSLVPFWYALTVATHSIHDAL